MSCTEGATTWGSSRLDRFDRLLLIGAGERTRLLYFVLLFFLIGAGMAIGRGATDALFYKRYGIEYLPVMYLILSVSLMAVSTVYAAFADMLPAERFFKIIFLALIPLLCGNWALLAFTSLEAALPMYFLLYEIASEVLLVHAMLYLSQNLDTQQMKRLSPLILAGMQLGTITGGLFLATQSRALGVQNMLLVWGGLLVAALGVLALYHRRLGVSPFYRPGRRPQRRFTHAVDQAVQGIKFARSSRLLRDLSLALFFMVIAFYVLCYSVGRVYTETFPTEAGLSAFFGSLTVAFGSIALLLQVFVTSRAIRHLGVKKTNLVFPVATAFCYAGLLLSFTLPFALLASMVKDTLMPSFRNPVRNIFFNALPGYIQGRARAMAVALVLPLALATAGGLLLLAQRMDDPTHFLAIGAMGSLGYIYFNIRSNKSYLGSIISSLREKVFLPDRSDIDALSLADMAVSEELWKGMQHPDDEVFVAYANAMLRADPERAMEPVCQRIATSDVNVANRLIPELVQMQPDGVRTFLVEKFHQHGSRYPNSLLIALVDLGETGPELSREIKAALQSKDPRRKATGVYCSVLIEPIDDRGEAWETWHSLLAAGDDEAIAASLEVLERLPPGVVKEGTRRLFEHNGAHLGCDACNNDSSADPLQRIAPRLAALFRHEDPRIRQSAVKLLPLLCDEHSQPIAELALEDDHPAVRAAAVATRFLGAAGYALAATDWITENRVSLRAQESILKIVFQERRFRTLLERVVRSKVEDARRFSLAEKRLRANENGGGGSPQVELVRLIAQERRDQSMRLALLALEFLEDPAVVSVIRAGLLSADRCHIANAVEALHHIDNRDLGAQLVSLMDDLGHDEASGMFASIHDVLTWCSQRIDPWLRSTSLYALKTLPADV